MSEPHGRRRPLTTTTALVATGAVAAGLAGTLGLQAHARALPRASHGHHAPAPPQRPNILFITADDVAPSDLAFMPHVQRLLVHRGTTFTDAIAPTPICVPARASLLTGQYTHNHRAYTIDGEGGGFSSFDSRRTLPIWLQDAGYDTLFIGKYLNGYGDSGTDQAHIEPGWTQWRPTVGGSTYNFMHPILNINGTLHHYSEYNSTLFDQQTHELLVDPQRRLTPWFMWVNYVAPHNGGPAENDDPRFRFPDHPEAWLETTVPDPTDKGRFAGLLLPRTPNLFARGNGVRSAGDPLDPATRLALRVVYEQRIEALQSVDRAVADTIATLKATGQYRDTILMFSSDNGYLVGQHDRYGKLYQFDDSERIPFVMAGQGVPKNHRVATPVTNPDIATTIAALAHAHPTRAQDGVNVMPWITKPTADRIIPVEAYPVHGGTRPIYTGIREGQFTYVHWTLGHGWDELYDRSVDPWELVNLAHKTAYTAELAHFRYLDQKYRDCAGDSCPKEFLPRLAPSQIPAHLRQQIEAITARGLRRR